MTSLRNAVRRWGKVIIIAAIFAMVATLFIVPRLPKHEAVSVDITVPLPTREVSSNYEYDGYYALQAVDLFSNTLASWFKSPDFVARIHMKANVPLITKSIRSLEKIFVVKKVSGQFITVSFAAKDEKQANDLGEAISTILKERVEQINSNGNHSLTFSVLVGKPLVILDQRDAFVDALIAGIVVFVFGFNALIILDTFGSKRE